jgi:nickel/cobalt exporter
MTLARSLFLFAAGCLILGAHPMGNFSINHYSGLYFQDTGVKVTYVLDFAEIPTFELFQEWQIDGKDQARLFLKAGKAANGWLSNLVIAQNGERIPLRLATVSPVVLDGAGGLPVLRVSMTANAPVRSGEINYEDRNFAGRAGWKEIVVDHNEKTAIQHSSQSTRDLSQGLTLYPTDVSIAPPQDLTARVSWSPVGGLNQPVDTSRSISSNESVAQPTRSAAPTTTQNAVPLPVQRDTAGAPKPAPRSFAQQQPAAPGTVVSGDYLSRLLQLRNIGWGTILLGLLAAFGLGAVHAMSPGHGKTIVAAYLVGSRGTVKHAALLGFVVTFTHTFTVFLLGLGVLFFQHEVIPEKITPILGVLSGLSIVGVGVMLLYQRGKALLQPEQLHGHSHYSHDHHHHHGGHDHGHFHDHLHHDHVHNHDHVHDHEHVHVVHTHPHEHQHNQESPLPVYAYAAAESPARGSVTGHSGSGINGTHSIDPVLHPNGQLIHEHPSDSKHQHSHVHPHHHDARLVHSHGGHTHSHAVPEKVTLGSLITLGVSGGLVPCPSALVLMLSAITLGRPALGLLLLIGFSSGLALVLMGFGMVAIYARHLLPDGDTATHRPLFRLIPIFSAVVVIFLGIAMAALSAGWLRPVRFL